MLAGAFVAIAALPDGGSVAGVLAFGLAGLGCSALLPLTISFAQEDLVAISAATAGLVIAAYQLGYGIAAFGAGPLQDAGVSLPAIFAIGAVAAAVLAGALVRHHPPEPPARRAAPATGLTTPSTTRQGATAMNLKDKVAIVTGGNSGIGMGIVLALAEEGANIVIDYVPTPRPPRSSSSASTPSATRPSASRPTSARSPTSQRLVDSAVEAFGRVDVMVNNAGIETRTSVLDTTEAQYERVLDINLKSAFFGTQIAAKQMIAQGDGGRIINITSVHEDWPMPGNTAYCLSKGGMRMLTRTAGVELAPHGVLVVGVGPGAVDTPINAATEADPEAMKRLDAAIPIGRMAEPDEIGSVVAFLAGAGASYLDGHHHLRRRRHHALQPRPLTDAAGTERRTSVGGRPRAAGDAVSTRGGTRRG